MPGADTGRTSDDTTRARPSLRRFRAWRFLVISAIALVAAGAAVGGNTPSKGKRPYALDAGVRANAQSGVPHLDAERMVARQFGQSAGVVTCPVSQLALERTRLRGITGTLSHWYWDHPARTQRAQFLAEVFVHEKPLPGGGPWGSHGELHEVMGERATVGRWNMRLAPRQGSDTIFVDHRLGFTWTVPSGSYVTLCVFVNNTHPPRYSWEAQLALVTNRDMKRTPND